MLLPLLSRSEQGRKSRYCFTKTGQKVLLLLISVGVFIFFGLSSTQQYYAPNTTPFYSSNAFLPSYASPEHAVEVIENEIGDSLGSLELPHSLSISSTFRFPYLLKDNTLMISLKSVPKPAEKKRNPIDLAIVLDVSGSMESESKLELCKKTLYYLLDKVLDEDDFVSLVTFTTESRVLFSGGKLNSENLQVLRRLIGEIHADQSTNLSAGLFDGLETLKLIETPNTVSAIFLLTDGLANAGITDSFQLKTNLLDKLSKFRRVKPSVYTFGYGLDADTNLLSTIASIADGNFYSIQSTETVPYYFAHALGGRTGVAAQRIQLTIKSKTIETKITKVLSNYPYAWKTKDDSSYIVMDIGAMSFGENRDILFAIETSVDTVDTPDDTGFQVSLTYSDLLQDDKWLSLREEIKMPSQPLSLKSLRFGNVQVERHLFRIEGATALKHALQLGESGKLDVGKEKLEEILKDFKERIRELKIDLTKDTMINSVMDDLQSGIRSMHDQIEYKKHAAQMNSQVMSHSNQRSSSISFLFNTAGKATSFSRNAYDTEEEESAVQKAFEDFSN